MARGFNCPICEECGTGRGLLPALYKVDGRAVGYFYYYCGRLRKESNAEVELKCQYLNLCSAFTGDFIEQIYFYPPNPRVE